MGCFIRSASVITLWLASTVVAQDVTINIQGNGSSAQYIEAGQSQQQPVNVTIGEVVRWTNNGNRVHTATATTNTSEIIFDTGELRSGESADIEFTRDIFEAAGGVAGGSATINYFCDFHPQMNSTVVLKDLTGDDDDEGEPENGDHDGLSSTDTATIRRDITTLTPTQLTEYRDAWRAIFANGTFNEIAGFHGCPRNFCHRDLNTFLAWHREYCLRLEQALQAVNPNVALHYWDWSSQTSITNGIPSIFTDRSYVSAGNTFANPLRRFRFACDGQTRFTNRVPRNPFFLANIAQSAFDSYDALTFEDFDSRINGPHGSVHTWIRGDMMTTQFAAYDPIFWAHHSNVDRQWASWQEAGGLDPTSLVSTLRLRGFAGRTVGDVVDFQALGYAYDRYDSIIGTQSLARNSRTFDVEILPSLESAGDESTELIVEGLPVHPKQSYFVHVFVGQPDATLKDVQPQNEHYVGSFGIFGNSPIGIESAHDHVKSSRQVANLAEKIKENLVRADGKPGNAEVTLLAEDKDGNLVPFDRVPIKNVRIGASSTASAPTQESITQTVQGSQQFTGVSKSESFSEAYKDAAAKAQGAFGPDANVKIRVVDINGQRGTKAGLTIMRVVIQASIEE